MIREDLGASLYPLACALIVAGVDIQCLELGVQERSLQRVWRHNMASSSLV